MSESYDQNTMIDHIRYLYKFKSHSSSAFVSSMFFSLCFNVTHDSEDKERCCRSFWPRTVILGGTLTEKSTGCWSVISLGILPSQTMVRMGWIKAFIFGSLPKRNFFKKAPGPSKPYLNRFQNPCSFEIFPLDQ